MAEIRVVAIRPMMPNVGIKVKLKIIPNVQVRSVSFRLMSVLPCPFMRFPELRFPNAVYKYVIIGCFLFLLCCFLGYIVQYILWLLGLLQGLLLFE